MWRTNTIRFVLVILFTIPMAARALELTVPGTGDGLDILKALGTAFTAENTGLIVTVPPSIGSGGGIAAVGAGRSVIARVARPLTEAEQSQGLRVVLIFRVPSAFFVNPTAGITELSTPQLRDVFQGTLLNWQSVGGAELKIRVVRRENEDSTLNVLRATMPGWKELLLTPKSKTAITTQDMVQSVREVEGAIGFGPYTPAIQDGLTPLKIDGLSPTSEKYPSFVQIGLVYSSQTMTPEAKRFLEFAKSAKASSIITNMGAAPIGE